MRRSRTNALDGPLTEGLSAPRVAQDILKALEEAAGGRETLLKVLQQAEVDSDEDLLVRALADPRNDTRNLAYVCAQAGFSVGRFLTFLRKGRGAAALMKAMDAIYEHTPKLADDVMKGALRKKVKCGDCGASGKVKSADDSPIDCTTCWGEGWVEQEPDVERQKVALQIAGLLKTGGGVQVGVQVNANMPGGSSIVQTSTQFRQATDALLFGQNRAKVVEAEIVSEAENARSEIPGDARGPDPAETGTDA